MGAILSLPGLALSGIASIAYGLAATIWVATAGPREMFLQGSRGVASVVARAALQLLASLVLSVAAYAALYAAFVPEAESAHPLHFGLCQPAAARAIADESRASSSVAQLPSPGTATARVARLLFEAADAPPALFAPASTSVQTIATAGAATLVPPLARAYEYTVGVCIRLPESPPNLDAGTFVASIRVLSASNRTLLSASRPLVLRYRSAQLRWMWTLFFALPLMFGWMDESQLHCTLLSEAFTNLRSEPAVRATIALVSPSACELQVYDATIRFGARLGSITQLMSQYFFTAAALGVGVLMAVHWVALLLFEMRPNNFATPPMGPMGTAGLGSMEGASAGARFAAAAARQRQIDPRVAAAQAAAAANAAAAAQAAAAAANSPTRQPYGDAAAIGRYDQFYDDDVGDDDEMDDGGAYFRTGDLYDGLNAGDDGGLRQRAGRQ